MIYIYMWVCVGLGPDEKGRGLSVGLAPPHRTKILATETLKTESTKNSSLEEEGSSSRGLVTPNGEAVRTRKPQGWAPFFQAQDRRLLYMTYVPGGAKKKNVCVCVSILSMCHFFFQIQYKGPPICRVACGAEFSMIADIRGNLYSFGCPEYGQLGMFEMCFIVCGFKRNIFDKNLFVLSFWLMAAVSFQQVISVMFYPHTGLDRMFSFTVMKPYSLSLTFMCFQIFLTLGRCSLWKCNLIFG